MRKWVKISVLVALALLILITESNARGGRGGGGARGGSRGGSRARSGSRGSRSGISGSSWRTVLLAGTLYGSRLYMTRRRYQNNPDERPTICVNDVEKDSNGTVYGEFICPMWDQSDDLEHCCGTEREERCCGFWEDPGRTAGAVVGFVFAGLVVIGCIACIVKHCCLARKSSCSSQREGACRFQSRTEASAKAQLPSGEVSDQPPAYGFKESDYKTEYSAPVGAPEPPPYDQVTKY